MCCTVRNNYIFNETFTINANNVSQIPKNNCRIFLKSRLYYNLKYKTISSSKKYSQSY